MAGFKTNTPSEVHVLVLEKNPQDSQSIQEFLTSQSGTRFIPEMVSDLDVCIDRLTRGGIDIVLLDSQGNGKDGLECLRLMHERRPELPIVIMTDEEHEAAGHEALMQGAQDYLMKGHMDGRMMARVLLYALERKQVEEKLTETLKRLDLAVKGSNYGLWEIEIQGETWDDPSNKVWYSSRFQELLGFPSDEMTESIEAWMRMLEPGFHDSMKQVFQDHYDRQTPIDLECRMKTTSGEIRWFRIRGQSIRKSDGKPERIAGSFINVSVRKDAEARLRQSEERFRQLIENSSDIITVMSRDGAITFQSPAVERVLGFQPGEMLGRNAFEFIHPEDYANLVKSFTSTVMTPGSVRNAEFRIKHKDGSWRYMEGIGKNLLDDSVINGIVINSRDITIRKKAEREMKMAEEKYRTIFDHSAAAITVTDEKERIVSWNNFAESLLGYTSKELHHKPVSSLYPEYEWRKIRSYDIRSKGIQDHLETRIYKKDGELMDIDVSITVLKDPEGNVTGSIGIIRDITERKRAEVLTKKLSSVVEQTADSVVITNVRGVIEYVNPRFVMMTGYSEAEAVGQTPRLLKSGKQTRDYYKHMWQTILGGETFRGELINRRKNGELYDEEIMITPVKDKVGGVTHFVATARDITDRKQAEEAMLRAKEEAELASRAKSDFLANMSHEIRTPMNGVLGMIGLLLDTELNAEQKEYAETVNSSADALLTIINDILDFSKIEAGKLTIEPIPFDLRRALEETVELMGPKARERGLELLLSYAPTLPSRFVGDVGRIRQIVTNLVSNSIKFTHEGHVMIKVEGAVTGENAELHLSVQDTGIGIDPAMLEKIFDKFTQADASTTRRYGGTGLGLAICQQLALIMGGALTAGSEVGKGSCFELSLPLPVDATTKEDFAPSGSLEGVRILHVDDNRVNRRVMEEQLVHAGVFVVEAEGGEAALEMMKKAKADGHPFDFAVLDCQMPGMSGIELGQCIREDPELCDTLLVMVTSVGERGDAREIEKIGFNAYLIKPLRYSMLLECLAMLLGARKEGRKLPFLTRHSVAEMKTLPEKKVSAEPAQPEGRTIMVQGARVLLAEDNIVNQKVAMKMLSKMGFEVDVVANGKEALEKSESSVYDLILMDCQMPEMDGYEATGAIRAREKGAGKHLPIIAMTAHAMQGDREKCIEAGMDDYLAKPVKMEELQKAVEKWVAEGRKGMEAKAGPEESTAPPEPVIDAAKWEELMMLSDEGDDSFLRELVMTYLKNGEERIAALDAAIKESSADKMKAEAHGLKGASGNVGARTLASLCYKLEMMGSIGSTAGADEYLGKIRVSFDAVRVEFARRLPGLL